MGWTTGWYSRRELVDHLTKTVTQGQIHFETLAKCFIGNNMWAVMKRTNISLPENDPKRVIRFVCLFYIRRYAGDDWGYKDVDETMGPCEVNCPLKYLDMAPEGHLDSEYATKWRENVREYWKDLEDGRKVAASLKYGDLFKGKNPESPLRVFLGQRLSRDGKPTGQILYRAYPDGQRYRMRPAGIVKAEAPAPEKEVTC